MKGELKPSSGYQRREATGASLVRERRRLISAGQLGPASNGGAFNPASLVIDGRVHLLCRAEANGANWVHGELFESRATPILCPLGPDLSLETHQVIAYDHVEGTRPEDWRLFHHQGRIYTNHCIYLGTRTHMYCSAAVSELDIAGQRIINQVILEPPFSRKYNEKNWVMFSHRGQLICLYSVVPYVLLEIDLQHGRVRTIANIENFEIDLGKWSAGNVFNSTNPVVWDENHYLTFVHHRFESIKPGDRNRLYMQFGMLIDRQTLLPVSVVPEPLLIGGTESGRHLGVHYTMSLMVDDDLLYAFYGEGDTHTGVVMIDKATLGDAFRQHYSGPSPSSRESGTVG